MFAAILSPGPDVVLALLFLSSAEKTHSDPDNLRSYEQEPKHCFSLFYDSITCVRLSELGQISSESLLKDFLLMG